MGRDLAAAETLLLEPYDEGAGRGSVGTTGLRTSSVTGADAGTAAGLAGMSFGTTGMEAVVGLFGSTVASCSFDK